MSRLIRSLTLPLGALLLAFTLHTGCGPLPSDDPPDQRTDGGNGGDGGLDEECLGADGCFECEPTTAIEILNACTDNACSPFDNKARLPLLVDGVLPPIP